MSQDTELKAAIRRGLAEGYAQMADARDGDPLDEALPRIADLPNLPPVPSGAGPSVVRPLDVAAGRPGAPDVVAFDLLDVGVSVDAWGQLVVAIRGGYDSHGAPVAVTLWRRDQARKLGAYLLRVGNTPGPE